jgi:hypothetical protein
MSAVVVNFTAVRTARMLRDNAPPHWIESFLSQMTDVAREQRDAGREEFWREVATLLRRQRRAAM